MEDNNGMVHSKLWIEEQIEDFMGMRYRVDNVLFSGKSEFQTVDVVETRGHGKMLLNDGLVMLTERDEFVYHDMITHVPLFTHPKPKRVLVIGGGDGGTAREVLRHNEVEFCKMVEIDKMVVDACVAHIPQTAACLTQGDARFELVIDDAVKYYKLAHYIVLPSYREGLSKVLLEAASCRRPIITTSVPGCKDIVTDSYNGFLCDPKDSNSLSSAITKAIQLDKKSYYNMANNGRKKIMENFTSEKINDSYYNIIRPYL